MKKFRYEFEAEMEKGCCYKCPLMYEEEVEFGYDKHCVLGFDWYNCQLVEVAE